MIVSLCGGNLTWQVVFFALVTLLAFVFLRPLLLKFFYKKKDEVKTNVDALIGRRGFVSEPIDPATGGGRVKVDGDDWKAVSVDNSPIEKGAQVEILKLDSVIVTVKRVN